MNLNQELEDLVEKQTIVCFLGEGIIIELIRNQQLL